MHTQNPVICYFLDTLFCEKYSSSASLFFSFNSVASSLKFYNILSVRNWIRVVKNIFQLSWKFEVVIYFSWKAQTFWIPTESMMTLSIEMGLWTFLYYDGIWWNMFVSKFSMKKILLEEYFFYSGSKQHYTIIILNRNSIESRHTAYKKFEFCQSSFLTNQSN